MSLHAESAARAAATEAAGRELSILLVEDNLEDSEMVQACLSTGLGGGYLLDCADTLDAAMDHLERFSYDVALVDLNLPDSLGAPTLASILAVAPQLPIVVLTSLNDEKVALDCIGAGAQEYIVKGHCGIEALVRSLYFGIQRKEAQEALRKSEARYRFLFERNLAGVYLADSAGRVLDCNDAFAHILGAASCREVLELAAWDLYYEIDQGAKLKRALQEAGEVRNQEIELRRVDGEPVQVLANLSFVDAPGSRGSVVQGTVLDVTEQRQLENRLQRSRQMEAIGRLAGGVAHDFNNILTSVIGYAELSLEEVEPDGSLHKNLQEIQEAGRRAALLTRQLLAFSRRQVMRLNFLDVNEVVRGFEGLVTSSVGESVEVELSLDPELNAVKADRGQLEMVLMDLALNARDAMPDGGKLTIITANVELDAVFVREHPGASLGDHVMLSLSDTGCGMDEETIAQVFEPFFTTKEASGPAPGLGLAAVYGVVKQSGGYVAVESQPGEGTSFDVYLPRATSEAEEAGEGLVAVRPSSQGNELILLAEDDRGLRAMAEKVLLRKGYDVISASDPAEALAAAEASDRPIDLLITDLVMPGMSGLELAKRLSERDSAMRVLLMSGYPQNERLDGDPFAAKAAFLGKPFKPTDLLAEVRMVLDIDPRGSAAASCGFRTRDLSESLAEGGRLAATS